MRIFLHTGWRGALSEFAPLEVGEYDSEKLPAGCADYFLKNGYAVEVVEQPPPPNDEDPIKPDSDGAPPAPNASAEGGEPPLVTVTVIDGDGKVVTVEGQPDETEAPDYESMDIEALRALAKERELAVGPRAKKEAIIDLLRQSDT